MVIEIELSYIWSLRVFDVFKLGSENKLDPDLVLEGIFDA